jgi:hypothetical protein
VTMDNIGELIRIHSMMGFKDSVLRPK